MRQTLTWLYVVLIVLPLTAQAAPQHHGPDCSGRWPTDMAQVRLKNEGLLRNEEIDFTKTKTIRLASENIGKDLWRQVYLVTFYKKSGGDLRAIVVHNASSVECSMTEGDVYVVSKRLPDDSSQ